MEKRGCGGGGGKNHQHLESFLGVSMSCLPGGHALSPAKSKAHPLNC